jgi:electron transport complex protein RnfG
MLARHMIRSALLLGLFGVLGTGVVALTYEGTAERIAQAEREFMLRSLNAVIPKELYNNDIFNDYIEVNSPLLNSKAPSPIFRARKDGRPSALAIICVAPDGYVGPIKLIVGMDTTGTVTGVRVLSHKETPGLGDAIEEKRSNWIHSFEGHSLQNPELKGWQVKRDGGKFDQFTGATITPRAVVKAVRNALKYYQETGETLFTRPSLPSQTG